MSGKISAIVLAAGNGRRMNSKTKKQYIMIKGKPVLWYSLFAFEQSKTDEVILVTSKDDIEYCQNEIVDKYNLKKVKKIVEGGAERYNSVYNGLKEAIGDIVLIHDGARPMVNRKIIEECIAGAESYKACVAAALKFFEPQDMKLITAVLFLVILVIGGERRKKVKKNARA